MIVNVELVKGRRFWKFLQCMPQPTLLTIDEDTNKLKRLQEENETLKQCLGESAKIENIADVNPGSTPQHPPIMDDFYIIAQYVHVFA